MATLRKRYKGPTRAKRCEILIPMPGSPLPAKCGDRVFKAGECIEHYNDRRNAQDSRRGTEAINIQRRERNGTPLPKDLSRTTVATREARPDPTVPEPIALRRERQRVSQQTQDSLVEGAARQRARRAGVDFDSLTRKKRVHWEGVRR